MELEVPKILSMTNNSDKVCAIRLFKVNMLQEIQPDETIKFTITNSEQLGYYEDICNELGITFAEIEPNEIPNPEDEEPEETTTPPGAPVNPGSDEHNTDPTPGSGNQEGQGDDIGGQGRPDDDEEPIDI